MPWRVAEENAAHQLYLNTPMLYERAAALTQFHIQGTVASSEYSQLFLSGDLPQAGGVMRVNFDNGFAPHAGDAFDLIVVNGVVTQPMLYQVQIGGLASGFQYTVQLSNLNTVRLTAVNDGTSLPDPVFTNGFDG